VEFHPEGKRLEYTDAKEFLHKKIVLSAQE
jgi:hypothetical protein